MPRSRILFTAPADVARISEILADTACEIDGREGLEFEDVVAHLEAATGKIVEVDITEEDDPLSPVWDIAGALDGTGSGYWATSDAFVERSRGIRSLGRILLNTEGGPSRVEMTVPWEFGEPQLDAETLVAGGMTRDAAAEVTAAFLSAAPAEISEAPRA